MQLPHKTLNQPELLNAIIENSDVAIILFDREQLFYSNLTAKRLLGITDKSSSSASHILPFELYQFLIERSHKSDSIRRTIDFEVRFTSDDSKWVEASVQVLEVGGQTFSQMSLKDISKSKLRETQLEIEATTDDLSGLGNRRQFRRILDDASHGIALAVVDVDHFKSINDSFGHLVGDNAIRFVASKLLSHFENELCVARLGGEEFAVVVGSENKSETERRFENFRQSIETGDFSSQPIKLTVSIGLAFSCPNQDVADLLLRADKALYQSKNSGRNRLSVAFED